ncbi:MAG: hypothetical protein Q8L14_37405 [Myxococcales bacterium]|nr:hypothetical protein [Myxococcales bacterium]
MRTLTMLAVSLSLFTGCIRSPIAMMASTRPLQQGGYTELGPVEETDCLWYLFSVFPISSGNDFQGAMRDAIRQKDGDALIQVTAETYYQNFLIVSRYCTIVQGIAVRSSPSIAPAR